ncbi:unnamed protein product [Tuber melanosporum]|uniref:(Perigord truffle) hypothetical protein n=1 Tax=Tuber melanosporum (strain Mel28) TaxID=656061 RepID=D5GLK4_TUBMM|nr:uncharacterized protein GSTUM_00010248001 [Tuber melanosporum]CAZ85397.1 unnamed protein product [Tuber melanosporum]
MFGALGGLLSQDGASRLLRWPRAEHFRQVATQNPRSVSTTAKNIPALPSDEPHWIQDLSMEFWNRLIGGSGSASSAVNKQPPPRHWQSLLHSWRNSREFDPSSQDHLRGYIKRLNELLVEEEKSSSPLCMNFCYEQQVFIALSKIGQAGSPGVIKECIAAFSTLIDNEDEEFLAQESFSQSLIGFLRKTGQKSHRSFEGEYVELLFSIAQKIRLSRDILPAWFTTRADEEGGRGYEGLCPQQKFAGITNKDDFPLFYLLIDYVHHEGRVGDFARTGLLYIIEAASTSGDLEKWIVESDLATLMASGLGALYSQLSRKLVVDYPTADPPTILVLSDCSSCPLAFGAESSTSEDFQTHLETFLSYLIFWQDVLEHCRSTEVKQTLLDHFQVLFLQQLLYPSLLESSDLDGGSSVAVLTYVRVVLDTLEHPDIIHLILSYLMALPDETKAASAPSSPSVAKRRKSLDLLNKVTEMDDKPSPDLFNLVDLVLTSLKSKSQQTVSATLKLISTILRKHHPYSISTLLKVIPVAADAQLRTLGAHNKEMELFFSLVGDISEDGDVSESYGEHLKDVLSLLESHPCSMKVLALKNSAFAGGAEDAREPENPKVRDMYTHTVHPNDPLLRSVVDLLKSFFSNTVETNLTLTAVIVDLATCSFMRPEGWLLFDPTSYEFDDSDDERDGDEWDQLEDVENELTSIMGDSDEQAYRRKEKKRAKDLKRANRQPRWTNTPPILQAIEDLVSQVQAYRRAIPDLDDKLSERKRAFQFTDELNDALLSSPLPQPTPPTRTSVLDSISAKNLMRPSSAHTPIVRSRQPSGGSGHSTPAPNSLVPTRSTISTPSPAHGISPSVGLARSPESPFNHHMLETTQRRIRVLRPGQAILHLPPPPEGESREGSVTGIETPPTMGDFVRVGGDFTLSHLLTNIMVLREFVLELGALVQVRASLFGDLRFA